VKPVSGLQSVFGQNAALSVDKITGNTTQNGSTFNLSANSQVTFSKLQKANQINFTLNVSAGKAGIILAQDTDAGSGVKIAFEPANNRIAAYVMNSGSDDLMNSYPLSSVSGTSYNVTASISNDVCVIYINDKIAFTNRIYNINNKKWSVFSSSESSFSNINIKNPN